MAGVSPSTVSRVMNGTANVDDEKKQRGFEGDRKKPVSDRTKQQGPYIKIKARIIGVILPNIQNPFFNEMARAIRGGELPQGYRLMPAILIMTSKKKKRIWIC